MERLRVLGERLESPPPRWGRPVTRSAVGEPGGGVRSRFPFSRFRAASLIESPPPRWGRPVTRSAVGEPGGGVGPSLSLRPLSSCIVDRIASPSMGEAGDPERSRGTGWGCPHPLFSSEARKDRWCTAHDFSLDRHESASLRQFHSQRRAFLADCERPAA
jgi:hypothetical protein